MPPSHLRLIDRHEQQPQAPTTSSHERGKQQQYIEELFKSYRDVLQRHIYRLLRNKDDAQELMQETFIRAMQQDHLEQQQATTKAYLFKIATNLVIDKARKNARQQRDKHQSCDDVEVVSTLPSPNRQVESQQIMQQLKLVLNELTPRCRQIFILHRFKEMSYSEIAEKMDITTRTVDRQMSIAMTLCRERLRGLL